MFGFGIAINVVEFVVVLSAGIKFNEKWPNAAHKVAFVFNIVETMGKWAYGLFTKAGATPTA